MTYKERKLQAARHRHPFYHATVIAEVKLSLVNIEDDAIADELASRLVRKFRSEQLCCYKVTVTHADQLISAFCEAWIAGYRFALKPSPSPF